MSKGPEAEAMGLSQALKPAFSLCCPYHPEFCLPDCCSRLRVHVQNKKKGPVGMKDVCVLLSCCCNKFHKPGGLKTQTFILSKFLIRSIQNLYHWALINWLVRLHSWKNLFFAYEEILTASLPWVMATWLKSLPLFHIAFSSMCVPFYCKGSYCSIQGLFG